MGEVEMVHSILYWSRTAVRLTEADLLDLLRVSRRANEQKGLTGMLLYKDGCFLQVLEGELRPLEQVFAKIEKDPRHECVTLLRTDYGPRQFAGWAMGFENLTKIRPNFPGMGVTDLMDVKFDAEYFGANPTKAQAMLLCFRGLAVE
jgi:hypothetical protein